MTKAELVDMICADNGGITKKAGADIVDAIFRSMQDSIKAEGKFSYPGFGTFTVRTRRPRKGIDPRSRKPIDIPETRTVGFKPAKAFKDIL